jgi:hypothetical protein
MKTRTIVTALVALFALSACGGESDSSEASACEDAFAEAAQVDEMQDAHSDLWPAFEACGSVEEFAAASDAHPDALDGVDPQTYAENQCASEPEVEGTPVCESVG